MSEYNIPVLVKWFAKRPSGWNPKGKMDQYMGTVIMCREIHDQYQSQRHGSDVDGHDPFWYWSSYHVIPNPTPSQIEEEARKAGKATVTTEKREPKLYEFWEHDDRGTAWLEPDAQRGHEGWFLARVSSGYPSNRHIEDRGISARCYFVMSKFLIRPSTPAEIDAWISKHGKPAKYTPEAAQSAQKGPMDPKSETSTTSVIKKAKETAAVKALREAEAKAEADQVRITAIRSLVALEEEKRKAKEHLKGIDDQIATLSKKWIKGVGK